MPGKGGYAIAKLGNEREVDEQRLDESSQTVRDAEVGECGRVWNAGRQLDTRNSLFEWLHAPVFNGLSVGNAVGVVNRSRWRGRGLI